MAQAGEQPPQRWLKVHPRGGVHGEQPSPLKGILEDVRGVSAHVVHGAVEHVNERGPVDLELGIPPRRLLVQLVVLGPVCAEDLVPRLQ